MRPSKLSRAALVVSAPLLATVLVRCGGDGDAPPPFTTGGGPNDAAAPPNDGGVIDANDGGGTGEAGPPFPCGALGATWIRCPQNPIARSGAKTADNRFETSVGDPDVMFDPQAGVFRGWWSTGITDDYFKKDPEISIRGAISPNGVSWTLQSGTALASHRNTDDWDYSKVETPSVVMVPTNPPARRYVMVYSGGNDNIVPNAGFTWYQIGLAFSADGVNFTRLPEAESPYVGKGLPYPKVEGLVLHGKDAFGDLAGVADGLAADPELAWIDGTYHLFFSSLAVNASSKTLAYGIGHATSTDAIHWTMQAGNPQVPDGTQPTLVKNPASAEYELFFVRDTDEDRANVPSSFNPFLGVFRITSSDLKTWSAPPPTRDFVWDPNAQQERYGLITAGDMVFFDGSYRYYYSSWSPDSPPATFVVPLRDGGLTPASMVLNVSARH